MDTQTVDPDLMAAPVVVVELDSLQVDHSYQREVKKHHRRIARDFDPHAAQPLTVCRRPDGSLWAIDGQQRIAAMKLRGISRWRATLIDSSGVEFEARLFQRLNGGMGTQKQLSPREMFRAQLVANDPTALAVKRAAESCGMRLSLGGASGWPHLQGLRTLYLAVQCSGEEVLAAALRCVCEAWPGMDDALDYSIIQGLVTLCANPSVDRARLASRLRSVNPRTVRLETLGAGGGSRMARAYAALARVYNRHLKHRIPESLGRGEDLLSAESSN